MLRNSHIVLLAFILSPSLLFGSGVPRAEKGILDLREYSFFEDGILEIKGEWLFYWEEIIDPVNIPGDSKASIVEVPSTWGQLKDVVPGIDKKGYATYYLKILLPENIERLAFRFTEVYSGSGYYVNGKHIGFNGFPGANPYQNLFDTRPSLFTTQVNGPIIELVVHVSNFSYRSGGMKGVVEMGIPMLLMEKRAKRQHRDFFFLGAFLIVGIFFMGMYFIHAELYKLFFSLLCLLFAFRMFLLSESGYMDWLSGVAHIRMEYISFSLMVPLFVMMIRYLFLNDFPKVVFRIAMWFCALMIILLMVSPISMFSEALIYYFIFVAVLGFFILYVLLQALKRGRSFAIGYTVGLVIVIAGTLHDILIVSDLLENYYASHYAMFAYVLVYALIFSLKSNAMLRRSERLSLEISEVNENLESIVDELTREVSEKSHEIELHQEELEARNAELQQLISIRNRFFTIIGHDIRGPIGYTGQMLDLLIKGKLSKKEEKEVLELLVKSSKATLNLLENLLIWGRSQIGNLTANTERFGIGTQITETVELFDHAIQEKTIDLKLEIESDIQVLADKEQFKMVIRNLLSNAIKFTAPGGSITLTTERADQSKELVLKIMDSGIGIPKVMQDKLFSTEDFHTTDGTLDEKGSGLGLKLCHELIKLNNGWIKVKSQSGKGTTFSLGLPMI